MLKDILKRGDYMTKVDLKDAYFMVPVHQKHQNLTRFMWKGKAYQFSCLPFGLSSAPWVFYQDHKANHDHPEIYGSQDNHVHRRHTHTSRVRGSGQGTHSSTDLPPRESGTGSKLLQITNHPISGHRIPEVHHRLHDDGVKTTRRKDQEDQGRSEASLVSDRQNSASLVKIPRQHATQAISPAPLFYRNLQSCLKEALERGEQDYRTTIFLNEECRAELLWWET